jgi:hypothetical protein
MRSIQRGFALGRLLVVIAVFALALAVVPARYPVIWLMPIGVGLPSLFMRNRAEFLTVMAIVATLVALLGPALVSAPSPPHRNGTGGLRQLPVYAGPGGR